jgi:hypothetical protein
VGEVHFGAGRAVPVQSGDDPAQVGDGGRQLVGPAGAEGVISEVPDQVVVPLRQLPPGRPALGRGHDPRGGVEQPAVQVGEAGLAHLVDQVGPDHVVQANRPRVVAVFQDEGQVGERLAGRAHPSRGRLPEHLQDGDGHVGILGKDGQLEEPLDRLGREQIQAGPDRRPYGAAAVVHVVEVEGDGTVLFEPVGDVLQRLFHRGSVVHGADERPIGQGQQDRPATGRSHHAADRLGAGVRDVAGQQSRCLRGGHLVELHAATGIDQAPVPRGQQPPASAATAEERLDLLIGPGIVDHEQYGVLLRVEHLAEPEPRLQRFGQGRPYPGQLLDQVIHLGGELGAGHLLTQGHPEQAARKALLRPGLVTDPLGHGGLAEAARAVHAGDADRGAVVRAHQLQQPVGDVGARDDARGERGRHSPAAWLRRERRPLVDGDAAAGRVVLRRAL